MTLRLAVAVAAVLAVIAACSSAPDLPDGGQGGGSATGGGAAGGLAGGTGTAGGAATAGGSGGEDDGGLDLDGGVVEPEDGGGPDAGDTDAGAFDAGAGDAGTFDGGQRDAGAPDAGAADAGARDAGTGPCNTLLAGVARTVTCRATAPVFAGGALVPGSYVLSSVALLQTSCPDAGSGILVSSGLTVAPVGTIDRVRTIRVSSGAAQTFRDTKTATTNGAQINLTALCPSGGAPQTGTYQVTQLPDGGVVFDLRLTENGATFIYRYGRQ